jgi:glutaredoxin
VVTVYTSATCGWAVRVYATLIAKKASYRLVDVKAADAETVAQWRRASRLGVLGDHRLS